MDYLKRMTLITVGITNGVIAVGIVGNILTFLVFSRRSFAKSSINIYCRAIAIFDSFSIVYVVFTMGTYIFPSYSVNKYDLNCKIMYFFIATLSPISGWCVVAFSIDQAINVANTQRLAFVGKRKFQLALVAALGLFHFGAYMIIPIAIEIKNVTVVISGVHVTFPTCSLTNIPFASTLLLIYLIESNFLPFFMMMCTTVFIIRALHMSARRLSMFNTLKPRKSMSTTAMATNTSSRSKRSKQRKFALNSIALNVLFVTLTSPVVIQIIAPSTGSFLQDSFLYRLFSLFFYINYSIHFFTHLVVNSIFRREFLRMFGAKLPNSPGSVSNYSLKR